MVSHGNLRKWRNWM